MMSEDDETMVLATMMQLRMDMHDSNPEMVEVTSKKFDAAARVAEVLRRHSIMDTAHSPAEPATPHPSASIIASTPLVTGAFTRSSNRHARRSSHLQDDRERQRFLANKMQQRMDMFDSNPKMVTVTSKNYDVAARVAEVLQAHHNYAQQGLVETDFDMDTYTFTYLDESQRERSNVNSGMPEPTKLSDADLRRLIDFVDAKIEAHANNLREEHEIWKGEAKDLILKLQETYPDLDVNAVTIESVAEEEDDTSPATPLRQDSTIDDSGIAELAQSVPFRMINAITPARPSSHLKEVTFADSLERGPQSIYPALPREHRKRNPSAMDETETTDGDDLRARQTNLQSALHNRNGRHVNDESTRLSVRTGRVWQPPAVPSRLTDDSTNLASNTSKSSTISRTPVRKISSGFSSCFFQTVLARIKVNEFRDSRNDRRWRSPRPAHDTTVNSFSRSAERIRSNNTMNTMDNTSHASTSYRPQNVDSSRSSQTNRPSSSKRARQV